MQRAIAHHLPQSRLMPSHFLSNDYLSQNPFPPFFIAEHDITYMEYHFGNFESAVQVVTPPTLARPWPTCWGDRERESLDNVQVLLSFSQNTPVLSTLF